APEIGIKPLPNAKVAIISSSWHLDICNDLIAGAQRALTAAKVSKVEVQFVPGSFEIPLAAQYAFEAGSVPMVRIHSECFTGDVVHSQRCDCGEQLEKSISMIEDYGHGYIVYLRDHEGRGIGLTEKIKAYQLQDAGMDTIDANLHLGHEIDARDWSDAIGIVLTLGLKELTLLTNNPNKVQALRDAGLEVTQANLTIAPNKFNEKYLATKEEKLGHLRGGK
ncbi:MAG: hypothetical protein RLZZ389_453, partial [Actinomycetota bacterium]